MAVISDSALCANCSEILLRAEAGESFTVIVAGKPVAQLGPVRPARRQQWVNTSDVMDIWRLPVDPSLAADLDDFGGELRSF
jgi:antitoxin (DNA-binding transcriptional repressor) of toxin-antitoxin stability system